MSIDFDWIKKPVIEKKFKELSTAFESSLNTLAIGENHNYFEHLKTVLSNLSSKQNNKRIDENIQSIKAATNGRELTPDEKSTVEHLNNLKCSTYRIEFHSSDAGINAGLPGSLQFMRGGAIISYPKENPLGRRIVKAHEIGHLLLHIRFEGFNNDYPVRRSVESTNRKNIYTETQAFYFAELLMKHRNEICRKHKNLFTTENNTYLPEDITDTIKKIFKTHLNEEYNCSLIKDDLIDDATV